MTDKLLPVVLAGGFGTRLWPLSQKKCPKQFLKLVGEKSLLEQAICRLNSAQLIPPVIVCNQTHELIAKSQCQKTNLKSDSILLEPVPLGTAGAIALAAIREKSNCQNSLLLVVPVDSYFDETDKFRSAIDSTTEFARQGHIVMFGIPPRFADINYGYIRKDGLKFGDIAEVLSFHEKPTLTRARSFIESNEYYWNSGIYLFRVQDYLNELNAYRPDIFDACSQLAESAVEESNLVRYRQMSVRCPIESVDRAVMEFTKKTVVKTCDMSWIDLGSWQALIDSQSNDSDGNAISGKVFSINTRDSYLNSNNRLISAVGISNAIVVETDDAVLVANKNNLHEIATVTEQFQYSLNSSDSTPYTPIERPWGRAETFIAEDGYLVKRLSVNVGQSLSLQKHKFRSEYWTVVNGEATAICGDRSFTLGKGESTYIPAGAQHRLSN